MKRLPALGMALALLVPATGSAQEPPPAPITATPLLPPTIQYPSSGAPPGVPGAESLPPQPGVVMQPASPPPDTALQPAPQGGLPQVQPPPGGGQGQALPQQGASLPGHPGAPLSPPAVTAPGQAGLGQPGSGQAAPGQAAPNQAGTGPAGIPGQPSAETQPPGPPPAPPPPNIWVPQAGAELQALDKINAQASILKVKDGQTVTFGSLSITVTACLVRPPDMPQNAAAYLIIVDSRPNQPGFKGWMLAADPSLSMLEHPLYDVRVRGCFP